MKKPYPKREPPVIKTCDQCGCEYTMKAWRARQLDAAGRIAFFCSRQCVVAYRTKRTPEDIQAYHAAYRAKHRDRIRQANREYWLGDRREKTLADQRLRYARNIEKNRERSRVYSREHKEEVAARLKKWAQDNPDKVAYHVARNNLAQQIGCLSREVPRELVEAHMEYLKIRRWVLDTKKGDAMTPTPETPPPTGICPQETGK